MLRFLLDFKVQKNLVMACHITGIHDVNRMTTLANDDYTLVQNWAEALATLALNGIVFHNNFSKETVEKYQNQYVHFVKIDYNPQYNPNVYRYFVYRDFLNTFRKKVKNLFVTDVSDVVTLKNPFVQTLFTENPLTLFCGDENKLLDNDWMQAHSAHLRQNITDYADFEAYFKHDTLLNCGIIGGSIQVMQPFINQLSTLHETYNNNNKTAYTGDMGAFNYLVRTRFNSFLRNGTPINTIFKAYETERTDCWFRHK
jgi:hypothetical protein